MGKITFYCSGLIGRSLFTNHYRLDHSERLILQDPIIWIEQGL
jgi:hypothetical protein